MRKLIVAFAVLVSLSASAANIDITVVPGTAPGSTDEEFVGPFANWINARTGALVSGGPAICTQATGNGITDDAAALQSCIDQLGPITPRLWIPAGTYRINSCLHVGATSCTAGQTALSSIGLIGADPATTILRWGGSAGGTLMSIRGVNYSQFNRLTFDGNNSAAILVDQDWISAQGGNFDTGNEYTDDVFKNATSVAFRCGLHEGCADTSMIRDQFINNFVGAFVVNQNALNLYFWYCLFQSNSYAVSNVYPGPAAPNSQFHVFNSVFLNSLVSDITYGNIVAATFRNNYSIGAGAGGGSDISVGHFIWAGGSNGVDPIIVQGNTVLDWTPGSGSYPQAIYQGDAGPIIVVDNIFRNAVTNASTTVALNGNAVGSLFSMGNTFTVGTISATCAGSSPMTITTGLCHSIDDQVVARSTVNPTQPSLPPTPPNLGRTIFEVAPGASAATIQAAINSAVAAGSRSVVHLQSGSNYSIGATLTTPANADIQIIGDGRNTFGIWSGSPGIQVLKINGPSKVVLRDFRISAHAADGIEVNNADQVGSRVFMQEVLVSNTTAAGIFSDTLDYTLVEMQDTQLLNNSTVGIPSLKVVGGASASTGTWLGAATNWFTGLAAQNAITSAQSAGGHLYVGAIWYDAQADAATRKFLTGTGGSAGAVSMVGTPMHLATNPSIVFDNFLGKDALVGFPMGVNNISKVNIAGTATGSQNLGLGLSAVSPPYYVDTSAGGTTEFLNSYDNTGSPPGGPTTLAETAISTPFLTSVLQQMRTTQPSTPTIQPAGVTDVRMYRVTVETGVNNIHVKH